MTNNPQTNLSHPAPLQRRTLDAHEAILPLAVACAVWLVFIQFWPTWLPEPKHGTEIPALPNIVDYLLTFATGIFLAAMLKQSAAELPAAATGLSALLLYCVGATLAANLNADGGRSLSLVIPTSGAIVGFLAG